ncbi:MAG: hypothetical protein ACREXM_19590 [Gammaproteobacteria bacterium]
MVHGSILLLRRGALLSAHRPDRAAETDIHLAFHSVRGRISSCAFPDALGQQQPGVTVAVKSIGRFEGVLDAVRIGGCRGSDPCSVERRKDLNKGRVLCTHALR